MPSRAVFLLRFDVFPAPLTRRRPFNTAGQQVDRAVTDFRLAKTAQPLAETLGAMDASAQLLLEQVREAKAKAERLEIALSLVVGVVANDPDLEEGLVL
jgi:hypothetical protein